MARKTVISEGLTKTILEADDPNNCIVYFKDDVIGPGSRKKTQSISGKGVLTNRISAHIMTRIEEVGVPTHFIKQLNMREQLVRRVEVIGMEVMVRNVAAGKLCERLNVEEGTILNQPVFELYAKHDNGKRLLINEYHAIERGIVDPFELEDIIYMSSRINDFLNGMMCGVNMRLVDFRIEFGRIFGEFGEVYLLLADEISPDNCRIWDIKTEDRLGRDRIDMEDLVLIEGYQEIAARLGIIPEKGFIQEGHVNEELAAGLEGIENELARARRLRSVGRGSQPRKL
ncbi:MAG: phosphoribosylaminoimidazolesuccinocarboxamide synthase [Pseudomonadota bacterium]|nr:phosphoribosylaminoimidazolesuccinocarboxamide synthase [Pseudomonadota bacterium]MED5423549.1 phosphoribosylaminoimidazolesuccinocarboxamide synthase [Pseudomonadota bacterium]